ncbi:MAG: hypothetical protein IK020_12235 [Clostridiales bacterium]|nr:hypothetical protein [Clostridiales bacterium]
MMLRNVIRDGENCCISAIYSKYDENHFVVDQHTDVFTVDDSGKLLYTLELLGSQAPCAVLANEYVFLGYKKSDLENNEEKTMDLQRTAVFLDKKTGEPVRTIETDFDPHYVSPVSDGFVIVGGSTINRYTIDGTLVKSIKPGFSLYTEKEGFFEDNSKFYAVEEIDMGEIAYHEVNFDTGECPFVVGGKDVGLNGRLIIGGSYFFNPDGEYKVDLQNMKVNCLADWNCIDICPPRKNLSTPAGYHPLDDERFAISYEYRDDSAEVLIFHYDPSIDRSKVQTIKIGGYGVYDDQVLQWVVYTFNVTSKEYRVILEDYSDRFGYVLPDERRRAILNLMQYFNDGNTPDIFYGTSFDYEYMGRNGMVIDMAKYLQDNETTILPLNSASEGLFYDGSGACYQLFSGYQMYGRYVLKRVADSVPDTSIFSLYKYAQENKITYSMSAASDIVDEAIRYQFADLWGAYDGQRKMSHEELVEMITEALSVPVSTTGYASLEDVSNGRVLMCPALVASFYDVADVAAAKDDFRYIGYPSVHGSVNLAIPQCCLAISTTAENKDKCWEVLSMLLSEDVQKQTLVAGVIPVTQYALDTLCDMVQNPDAVKDETLIGYLRSKTPATQEAMDLFLETISTVDTIATYDWGVFDIISDEVNSYFTQTRDPEQIADTLEKRLTLYMQENYQ